MLSFSGPIPRVRLCVCVKLSPWIGKRLQPFTARILQEKRNCIKSTERGRFMFSEQLFFISLSKSMWGWVFFYVQQQSSSIRSCLHLLSTDSQFFSCLSRCTSFRALKHTSVKYPGNWARDDCGTQRLQSRPSSDCTGCGECAVCAQCCEWFSRGLNLACVVDIMIASLNPFYTDTRHPAKWDAKCGRNVEWFLWASKILHKHIEMHIIRECVAEETSLSYKISSSKVFYAACRFSLRKVF